MGGGGGGGPESRRRELNRVRNADLDYLTDQALCVALNGAFSQMWGSANNAMGHLLGVVC